MSNIIASPGVQFNEIDYSFNSRTPNNNTVYIMGFASQGPIYEPTYITSLAEYEQTFGVVTNSAERYLYHSARQILTKTQSQLLVTRLAYDTPEFAAGDAVGDLAKSLTHSVLLYPIIPNIVDTTTTKFHMNSATEYHILPPINIMVSQDSYDSYRTNGFDWSRTINYNEINVTNPDAQIAAKQLVDTMYSGSADIAVAEAALSAVPIGFVVANDVNSSTNNIFEGLYVGISDNSEIDPSTGYKAITGVKVMDGIPQAYNLHGIKPGINIFGYNTWIDVQPTRLAFELSVPTANSGLQNTLSEIVAKYPLSYSFSDPEYNDSIVITLFSLKKSIYETTNVQLNNKLLSGVMGSLNVNKTRIDANGGAPRSAFIEDVVNSSPYFSVFVNKDLSHQDWEDTTTTTVASKKKIRVADATKNLYALGKYSTINSNDTKSLGSIPDKINIGLSIVESIDEYPLDITCDAGLSTIWTSIVCKNIDPTDPTNTTFNDEELLGNTNNIVSGPSIKALNGKITTTPADRDVIVSAHNAVASTFTRFASYSRRDHIHISDPLRHIFIEGQNFKKVMRKPTTADGGFNFYNEVTWPLTHLYSQISTSYVCTYPNWFAVNDGTLRRNVWIPPSAVVAANIINTSPFQAPAGFTRGIITDVADTAVSPNQGHRDKLYRLSFNAISTFPGEGIVIFGQKTLLNKPSAFDRINVRRTFLHLEKSTNSIVKYFVFEPNTYLTRNRLTNTLIPIFESAKSADGIYDYKIVCDERNNTPTVIDSNELIVDIYVKPTRTAEFILVNFYATRTDQKFSELVANA